MKKIPAQSMLFSGILLVLIFSAGCAGRQSQEKPDPRALTEKITRALYAEDMDAATLDFDEEVKRQVTHADVGALSDRMHAMGAIKSVAQRSAQPDQGRYDYDVVFDRGSMIAQVRFDSNGKVGAYHLVPRAQL